MKPGRIEAAVALFNSGCNCAQSVFSAYAPLLGIDEADALRIAWGFGAGMGRLQHACGAVTGGIMLIGASQGRSGKPDTAAKEQTYSMVKELCAAFTAKNGTIMCSDLLQLDLNTPEGKKRFTSEEMHVKKCILYVRQCAELVEEMLF